MNIPTVFLLTLLSSCILAQPAKDDAKERSSRASPGQLQYSDPDGSRVDWKQYAPQNQWRSHLDSAQRHQRAETGPSEQPKAQPQVSQPVYQEPQYQPFSAVPSHIKQLIVQTYPHGGPYVDPGAFFYQAAVPVTVSSLDSEPKHEEPAAHSQNQNLEREYFSSAVNYQASGYHQAEPQGQGYGQVGRVPLRGGIKYKDEERLATRSTASPYGQSQQSQEYQPAYKQAQFAHNSEIRYPHYEQQESRSEPHYERQAARNDPRFNQYKTTEVPDFERRASQQYKPEFETQSKESSQNFDKGMPMAIQRLLSYQAQLPYHVIANQIVYRPKEIFIPKPLPDEDIKLSKHYPSKIYFLKTDGQIFDNSEVAKDENKSVKRY